MHSAIIQGGDVRTVHRLKLLINALIIHVGTGPDLSDLPKNYSDSAVAD